MNASKEQCLSAIEAITEARAYLSDLGVGGADNRLKGVLEFLHAAHKKLSWEKSYDKEKAKKEVKDVAEKGFNS